MQTQKFFQKMKDGTEIAVNRWIPDDEENIKGVIQLSHGMQEHSLRYDRLGCILAEKGYVFNAHDHRGHGKTAQKAIEKGTGKFQLLDKKNGFNKVVSDLDEVIEKVKSDYAGKPVILLGHSFGSFVSQAFIERYGEKINGCCLCGSKGPDKTSAIGGAFLAALLKFFGKAEKESPKLQNIAFGSYNDKFKDENDDLSWLSKSKANRDMYKLDSWCGGTATVAFFGDICHGLKLIHKKTAMKSIPSDLPVYIIYGEDDPVGNYGKSLEALEKIYKENGMSKVTRQSYPGDRHEILNEDDSEQVIENLLTWISTVA